MDHWNLIPAILFGVSAGLRVYSGLRNHAASDFILAAVFLAGAIIWFVRYLKQRNN